jgi:hypothetical protein
LRNVRIGMALRDWLKRIENNASSELSSFALRDGTRHYWNPAAGEVFMHTFDCLATQLCGEDQYPDPPETVVAITRAKNRARAVQLVYGDSRLCLMPYSRDDLIERGVLTPQSMVEGKEIGEPPEDLSE